LVTDKGKTTLDFEGEEVSLNRDNLDANNKSISGGQHAKIEYENGQWYIKDQSSNGFTFIQVRDRMPIQSGDMIIMGNKLFVFKEK
jgi:predicted component of type VI protein secretion system